MDQMMEMMVKYANHLEEIVQERTRLLNEEKMKTVDLLHRMLPKYVIFLYFDMVYMQVFFLQTCCGTTYDGLRNRAGMVRSCYNIF